MDPKMQLQMMLCVATVLSSSGTGVNSSENGRNGRRYREDDSLAGVILLHGLGVSMGPNELCEAVARSEFGLGLSERTIIRCPKAKHQPVGILPPPLIPDLRLARSWFNFWMMPADSVLSPTPGESKDELAAALLIVEEEIEDLMRMGVPSRNIVVGGCSQGGALTFYTAIHSKYQLGGFLPMVTWLPLLQVEPPIDLPFWPVNQHTPIFHMNGMADIIVPVWPAGKKTEAAMNEVFTQYTFNPIPLTTHATTFPNPVTMPILKRWLKANTNLIFLDAPQRILKAPRRTLDAPKRISESLFSGFSGLLGLGR